MTETSLSLEIIKTRDLASYVRRPGILTGRVVPICPLRAAAHAANPAASPDDPALIVATREDECVGYLGLMPGQLRVDGQIRKIFWYSTWYSAQGPEGKGVGGVLVHASLRLGVDLVTTGLDPKTFEFFRGLRFKSLGPLEYSCWTSTGWTRWDCRGASCRSCFVDAGFAHPWSPAFSGRFAPWPREWVTRWPPVVCRGSPATTP